MNERTLRDRLHALAPLVLRLALAAILVENGLSRAAPLIRAPEVPAVQTGDAAPVEPAASRFTISGDWAAVLGLGELGAAALLAAGCFTRLTTLPILAMLGYGVARAEGWTGATGLAGCENTPAMLLLAAACLSLLISGSGVASWDSFAWSRRQKRQAAPMMA